MFSSQRNSRVTGKRCSGNEAEAAELRTWPGNRAGGRPRGLQRLHPYEDQGRDGDRHPRRARTATEHDHRA